MPKIMLLILLTTLLSGCVGFGDLIHFSLPADADLNHDPERDRKKTQIEEFAKENNLEPKCTLEFFTAGPGGVILDLNVKIFGFPTYIIKKRKEQALNACKKSDQTVSEQELGG